MIDERSPMSDGGPPPWAGWTVALAAPAITMPIGVALGVRWLLPVLAAAPAYALMASLLCRGRRRQAVVLMLVWAAAQGVMAVLVTVAAPQAAAAAIVNGEAYRDEMYAWLASGVGRESSPARFLPQHALHLGVFLVLAVGTASAAALPFGAALMNYMGFYVGSLFLDAVSPLRVLLLGWTVWSMFRVAAFVLLGVVAAEPLLGRLCGYRVRWTEVRRIVWTAAGLLLVDVGLKTVLAPWWPAWLRGAVELGAGG